MTCYMKHLGWLFRVLELDNDAGNRHRLDRAIKAAQDNGAEVSRDDWVFPNWNPMEDYGLEMYDEL